MPLYMLQDTLCIDSSGDWLSGWASRHARAGTHSLRGPLTHSPHKSPTALLQYGMQSASAQVDVPPPCRATIFMSSCMAIMHQRWHARR